MKIVHVAPCSPYNEGWGYQENILPKYHQKLGAEVTLIVSTFTQENGRTVEKEEEDYINGDGIRVIRRVYKKYPTKALTNMYAKIALYPLLKELRPDYIFFHSLLGTTIYDVVRYKKKDNPSCFIVRDNHLDKNIGTSCMGIKQKVIRAFHRYHLRRTVKFVEKIYGVTPWRKTYAEEYFLAPKEKTDVLIMGADDEKINFAGREGIRREIREKYGVEEDDFLVVTGGKLEANKKVRLLMQACKDLSKVKLLVFGSVSADEKDAFEGVLSNAKNIVHIGWVAGDKVYDYFLAADLVAFPGQHSVLWEQACATKTPCLFAKWEGMEHVDNGGNSAFVVGESVETWRGAIKGLQFTQDYQKMLKEANSDRTDVYLYSKIAQKSIEDVKKDR